MSMRAEILRLGLRWLSKDRAAPAPDIVNIRKRLDAIKPFIPGPPRGTKVTAVDAGGVAAARVATRGSLGDRHVLYLHGGAYTYGSPAHYNDFLWRVSAATSASVLCIDYRLAPEHPFPAAVDDAVSAYRWLIAAGAAPGKIAIMGDSAGGGLVFATLLKLRDEGVDLPAAAVALSPWTDLALTGASLHTNEKADPMLRTGHVKVFAGLYLSGADPRHPYASPVYGDAAALPPTLIQVGGDEILLDDAVRMAEALRAAGCSVDLDIFPRMPHVWQLFARVVPEGRRAVQRIGAFVQSKLGSSDLAL